MKTFWIFLRDSRGNTTEHKVYAVDWQDALNLALMLEFETGEAIHSITEER